MAEEKEIAGKLSLMNTGKSSSRKRTEEVSAFVYGRKPPQAIPLEEACLGAILLEKEAIIEVLDILRPDSFYLDSHQLVYKAMLRLFEKSQPIDMLTVAEELRKSGDLEAVGGSYFLVDLTHKVASSANLEFHARIVAQKFIQRELIRVSNTIIKDAFEDTTDVFELLDSAEKGLFHIAENNMTRSFEPMSSLAARALRQMEELRDVEEGLSGIPSGFSALDRLTNGWQSSDLIILAARPGMGKTSFVLSVARNAAVDFSKGVAFFSLEMSAVQLAQRLISMQADIPLTKLRSGKLTEDEWKKVHRAIEHIGEAPIYFDDTPAIDIFELRAKCRRMKLQHDIQLVVVDYLQLMRSGGDQQRMGNREQEVSAISRALKGLAKEIKVPVIALSQLSRAVETRGGPKRPQLSDLRESGSIEQDADIVGFIYRPEYYQITEDENGMPLKGIAEIIIAKHRNGATDTIRLKFTEQFARFSNLDNLDMVAFPGDIFDQPFSQIITRSSRMNDDEDIPF